MSLLGSIIPGWKWISGTIAVVVIGVGAWWVIDALFIGPRDLSSAQREALLLAAAGLETQLLERLDATDRHQLSLAVLPVKGDTSGGEAEDVVKSVLKKNKRFAIPGEGVLSEIKKGATGWLFGEDSSGPEKLLGQRGELDGVLFLSLERENRARIAGATLEGKLFEHAVDASGKRTTGIESVGIASTGRIEIESGEPVTASGEEAAPGTFWRDTGRFLLSVILLLGIPFLWLPATDWIKDSVRLHNNNFIAIAWVVFVVATAMAPYALFFLFTEEGGGTFAWIVGVSMAAFAAVWTYAMHSAWSDRVGA